MIKYIIVLYIIAENLIFFNIVEKEIQLIKVEVYDSGYYNDLKGNEVYIESIDEFTVDDKEYIYIFSGLKIHVLSPTGDYITSIGGEGRGPGEFHQYTSFENVNLFIQGDSLFAFDKQLQRINVYSINKMEPIHTILLDPDNWYRKDELKDTQSHPNRFWVRNDGNILMEFRERFSSPSGKYLDVASVNPTPGIDRYFRYYLMNMNGKLKSPKICEFKDVNFYPGKASRVFSGLPPHLPSARSSLISVSDKGYIFKAWTEEFEIKVFDPQGKYTRTINYPYKNSQLNKEKIINNSYPKVREHARQTIENAKFPNTWPALNTMFVDDEDRIWVSTITDSYTTYTWWVINRKGDLLGRFKWPGEKLHRHSQTQQIKTVRNGHLYVYKKEETSGAGRLEKYKIIIE